MRVLWKLPRAWGPFAAVLLLATLVSRPSALYAAEEVGEPEPPSWSFLIVPYLWLPTVHGSASIETEAGGSGGGGRLGAAVDLNSSSTLGGGMLRLEAQRDELGLFVDGSVMGMNTAHETQGGRISVDSKILAYLVEYGATYRLLDLAGNPEERPITVDALVGARWNRLTVDLSAPGPILDREWKVEFLDPIVGGRFAVPLVGSKGWGDFGIAFRGDIGGFGAGSELAWNIVSGLRWDMPWKVFSADLLALAGYRAYYVRANIESGAEDTALAVQTGGPVLGIGVAF